MALPDGEPPEGGWPGIIVLFEVFGMTPEMLDVADRFADRGWAAFVPDFLSTGTRLGCLVRAGRDLAAGRPGPLTETIASASRDFQQRDDVDAERVAVIGFCLGGSLALLLGSVGELGLRAVAANYGATPKEETLRTSPPVVASFGGRDRGMRGQPERLEQRLGACGVPFDIKTYPEAGHSFLTNGHHPVAQVLTMPTHIGFVPGAARDAWERIDAWLDRYARGENG
jgi:carboxymethylenebutenolidase